MVLPYLLENTFDRKHISANSSPNPNSYPNSNPNPKAQCFRADKMTSFFEQGLVYRYCLKLSICVHSNFMLIFI